MPTGKTALLSAVSHSDDDSNRLHLSHYGEDYRMLVRGFQQVSLILKEVIMVLLLLLIIIIILL